MKQIYLAVLLTFVMLSGCFNNKIVEEPKSLNGDGLKALILSAINGDKKANDSLSGLVDLGMAENINYNNLEVDSFHLDSIKYFSVLIEYPNPINNRFAVYDSLANCFLIDKSLNGSLSFEVIELQDLKLLKVIEKFISKDTLSLSRLSFYRKIENSVNLVYRSFAELKTLKNHFYQTINFISLDTIKTQIQVPKKYKLNMKHDIFVFDSIENKYRSNQSLFDSLVYREIADFDFEIQKPQN
jgi:hypothetical protein